MKIRIIPSHKTLPIRQLILRPGKALDACTFEGDNVRSNVHLGAFKNAKLVGVVSLIKNKSEHFKERNQFQLRGMAVLPEFRGRHIATALLQMAEERLRDKQVETLWCNAREIAIGLYEKHGFEHVGNTFEVPGIGLHRTMYKRL